MLLMSHMANFWPVELKQSSISYFQRVSLKGKKAKQTSPPSLLPYWSTNVTAGGLSAILAHKVSLRMED